MFYWSPKVWSVVCGVPMTLYSSSLCSPYKLHGELVSLWLWVMPAPAPPSNPLPCDITVRQGTCSVQAHTPLQASAGWLDHREQDGIPFNPVRHLVVLQLLVRPGPSKLNLDKWTLSSVWIFQNCGWPLPIRICYQKA